MALCPFCKGAIPDDALKCQHCGEWAGGRPSAGRSELGLAARRFVNAWIAMTVVVLLLVAWLMWFFVVPNLMAIRHDFFR
jgi:hypothetical protein